MAILELENGKKITNLTDIARKLTSLAIELKYWQVGDNPRLNQLLNKASLSEEEKEEVLINLDHYFVELRQKAPYQTRDLIVLHPKIPNLDVLLSKFERCHTHADDEVRYVIEGEGVFGFVLADKSKITLTVQAGEYINIPAGTKHWFYLTKPQRIKAVRYFSDSAGWIPEYTS